MRERGASGAALYLTGSGSAAHSSHSGADAVIHLAWAIQPSRDALTLERINVEGSRRVFEAVAVPLAEAPSAYEMFQKKEDGAIKVVLKP